MTQDKARLQDTKRPVLRDSAGRRLKSIALAAALPLASCGGETPEGSPPWRGTQTSAEQNQNQDIKIKVGTKTLLATLRDTATAKDFISLLPLTIQLKDYASTEKISDLPRKLTKEGAPAGADPSPGDIAYYAPWGNLAIYYRDSPHADGLIILGKIQGDPNALKAAGAEQVTVELARP